MLTVLPGLCRNVVGTCRIRGVPTVVQQLQRRHFSSEPSEKESAHDQALFSEWRTIYSLPSIRLVAALSRLKVYQGAVTVAGLPIAFALGQTGQLGTDVFGIYAAIGISGLATLSLVSLAARNLVGFIYINEQQDLLKLAYVDFWGRRKETLVDTEDLLPNWEQSTASRLRFVVPIGLRSDPKQRYKLLNRFGQVSDPELFEGLFGS
ncbi:hypothetical protein KR026_009099 [Drosophila bipectinata]|nr:hypothetical protein KR026_009099 [Drosophila bipectinata]